MQAKTNHNDQDSHPNEMTNSEPESGLTCPSCGFTENALDSTRCEICFNPLKTSVRGNNNVYWFAKKFLTSPGTARNKTKTTSAPKRNLAKSTPKAYIFKRLNKNIGTSLGYLVLGVVIALWINRLFFSQPKADSAKQESPNPVEVEPKSANPNPALQGLFSYGGAPFYAPLVAKGLNNGVESSYPGVKLRFAKPLNQDYSNSYGIKMLLEDELSFAFSGRSINDAEYRRAVLRGDKLEQIDFAIDGIVFFGNNNKSVSKLNMEQVRGIFEGSITNWNQINQGQNLPIVPILLDDENLAELGISPMQNAKYEYAPNYTQALRKVIATPGAVSFASASLVQGQQLIDIFALADSDLSNYTPAFIEGKANLAAFKSGDYPLTRRLFLAYRQDGSDDQKAGEAYANYLLSQEGQEIVEQAGFVPIK